MKRLIPAGLGALAMTGALVIAPTVAQAAEWPVLQSGHRGVNVESVQHLLHHHGHPTDHDGIYGPDTAAKVSDFQDANELDVDGIVGPQTWPELVVDLEQGTDAEHAVHAAQLQLIKHGQDHIEVTGTFDEAMADAVRAVQEELELEATGTIGLDTWRTMVATSGFRGEYSLPLDRGVKDRDAYNQPHHTYPAIDLGIPEGTPVYAISGGTATPIPNTGSCGFGVQINAEDGGEYVYCHFRQAALVDGPVAPGEQIGYSGNTGTSTGPHLHVQIKTSGGTLRCPQQLLLAIYDEETPPALEDLPTSGCFY